MQRGVLLLIFGALFEFATKALEISRLRSAQLEVTDLDDDGNNMMRTQSQPADTATYTNQSLLFFSTA